MLLGGHLGEIPKRVYVLDSLTYAGSLENLSSSLDNKNFEFVNGDIRNPKLVNDLFSEIDLVVHFAAESHVDRSISDSSNFISTNVLGTHVLLEASVRENIATFLHVSTDEVYGSIDEGFWDENQPLQPNSPYAASKAASDLIVRSFGKTHGLDVRISRCSNNYGPFQYPEKLIPLVITNLMSDKKIPVYGDGMNKREWIHCEDHSRAIHKILLGGTPQNVYNIAGQIEISNLSLVKMILGIMGKNAHEIEFVRDRKGHDFRYALDGGKLQDTLNFTPKIDFEIGLRETVNWYVDNQNWWKSRV
ncbi:dTDP-glucose 4,6-dehydratase [Candidatus Planktophila vernalis]|uniref:dTDP-glucose 4,6-dehydratase n=2 Tax=Candidatus Planktophila vernalis TaxID=1884907 RepID=A0A249KUW9_9ACTN|nr:dTDP-glucose 4,6-dehydratase [Candidatus Planktophila vernalis]